MYTQTIGFIGLGLIGGSIAKAIRRVYPSIRMIAYDQSKDNLIAAMSDDTINQASDSLDYAFSTCDIIFMCTPVSVNIQLLPELKKIIKTDCILTDVGSVKSTMHDAIHQLGMDRYFIGGHPMAGSEKTGFSNANDRLLENAYYILTPADSVDANKIELLQTLLASISAVPVILDCKLHDHATAAISHLPHVIAYALVNLIKTSDTESGLMRQLAAGGFKDMTRIAASSPAMWQSICIENKEELLSMIDAYQHTLSDLANQIKEQNAAYLYEYFDDAKDYRESMPIKYKGSLTPAFELYVDLIDESGAIATLATILATNNISIKNIGIIHNREFADGVLRIEFYEEEAIERAHALLNRFSYIIHRR